MLQIGKVGMRIFQCYNTMSWLKTVMTTYVLIIKDKNQKLKNSKTQNHQEEFSVDHSTVFTCT